jgi:hypothetical protein
VTSTFYDITNNFFDRNSSLSQFIVTPSLCEVNSDIDVNTDGDVITDLLSLLTTTSKLVVTKLPTVKKKKLNK